MSTHVASWAWKQQLGDAGLKLVLVKLADNADDTGYSYWRQARLAEECEMSKSTVQRKLKKLGELGIVEVVERAADDGSRIANGYRLLRPTPRQVDVGVAAPGDQGGPGQDGDAGPTSLGDVARTDKPKGSTTAKGQKDSRRPLEVSKIPVTADEHDLTDGVLAAFNEAFDAKFASVDFRKAIIGRIRERPDMTLADHAALIVKMQRKPWWKGDASPSVIYGNGRTFDRCVNQREDAAEQQSFGAYDL